MSELVKFEIKDARRSPFFERFIGKFMVQLRRGEIIENFGPFENKINTKGVNFVFPGANFTYAPVPADEPTDSPKGESEQFITAMPDDTVGVSLGGAPRRMFTVPKGKKATRIRYNYEIILEDLPKCDQCHGSGQISLFTTVETCGGCNGSGYKRS